MEKDNTKQHITPRSYLKRFATEVNGRYLIGTRRENNTKQEAEFFLQRIENVAWKKNFYDTTAREDIKFWEHYLAKEYDSLCGIPLDQIIFYFSLAQPEVCIIPEWIKDTLSRIILSQAIRVPSVIEPWVSFIQRDTNEYIQHLMNGYSKKGIDTSALLERLTFSDDQTKDTLLSQTLLIDRLKRYCKILSDETWIIYCNTCSRSVPFCTSDNPVMFMNSIGRFSTITDIGIASKGTIIYFPITPKYLVAVHSNTYRDALESMNNKIVLINDVRFINNVNLHVISQCHQHSFLPEPLYTAAKGELQ